MKKTLSILSLLLLLGSTMAFGRLQGDVVKIADDITNGQVTYTVSNNLVTLTVTPAAGYYLEDISAVKTISGSALSRTRADIPVGGAYELTKTSTSADRSQAATYTLTLEGDYGAYVTAQFAAQLPTIITLENPEVKMKAFESTSTGATLTPAEAGNLVYTTSNADVAKVEKGKIVAVGVGKAAITVSFAAYDIYAAAESQVINVTVAALDGTVSAKGYEGTYDGKSHTISVTAQSGATVKYGTTAGTYDLSEAPAYTDAGTYTVYYQVTQTCYNTITGSQTVAISPKTVSNPTITLSGTSFEYTGEAITPTVVVKDGSTTIPAKEYTVGYKNNTEAGTATVTITDNEGGNYTVSGSTTFEITSTDEPSTDDPSTDDPSTDDPSTDDPSTDDPSTDDPSTDDPSTDDPSTDDPSTDDPSTDDPSTDDPSTDEPTTEDVPVTISKAKQVPYYSEYNLDFTNLPELKAYVATGYDKAKGTIWLTRVKQVPAETGFLLMGEPGDYDIPVIDGISDCYYKNMFKGTLTGTTIQTTEGKYTNYYLSNGKSGVGFYKVTNTEGQKIGANRCYLPILTDIPANGSEGDAEVIKVSAAKQVPYYTSKNVDFTSLDAQGVKAYTATGYNYKTGIIWLTRVKKVPAQTGILVMADKSGDYNVPTTTVQSVYENMFVGSETAQTIYTNETIDGVDYVNYYLSSGTAGVGFYKVTNENGVKMGANRCYLPIPKRDAASGARGKNGESSFCKMVLSDEANDDVIAIPLFADDATGIDIQSSIFNLQSNEVYYNLQGQRIDRPSKGLYIRNGRVVVIRQ